MSNISSREKTLPKATSAEDLFNLVAVPPIEAVEIDQSASVQNI